jgi:hypothetical protein
MILAHGFPAWGPAALGTFGTWLFNSAVAPLFAILLFYGSARWRRITAGFALGVGAHLAFVAIVGTSALPALWLASNALASLGVGWLALRK